MMSHKAEKKNTANYVLFMRNNSSKKHKYGLLLQYKNALMIRKCNFYVNYELHLFRVPNKIMFL